MGWAGGETRKDSLSNRETEGKVDGVSKGRTVGGMGRGIWTCDVTTWRGGAHTSKTMGVRRPPSSEGRTRRKGHEVPSSEPSAAPTNGGTDSDSSELESKSFARSATSSSSALTYHQFCVPSPPLSLYSGES